MGWQRYGGANFPTDVDLGQLQPTALEVPALRPAALSLLAIMMVLRGLFACTAVKRPKVLDERKMGSEPY